jgi:hypothetical protein
MAFLFEVSLWFKSLAGTKQEVGIVVGILLPAETFQTYQSKVRYG